MRKENFDNTYNFSILKILCVQQMKVMVNFRLTILSVMWIFVVRSRMFLLNSSICGVKRMWNVQLWGEKLLENSCENLLMTKKYKKTERPCCGYWTSHADGELRLQNCLINIVCCFKLFFIFQHFLMNEKLKNIFQHKLVVVLCNILKIY